MQPRVALVAGLLVVHMQMMVDPDSPSHVRRFPTSEDTWTAGWTVVYVYIVSSLSLAALMDPSRLGKLKPGSADWLIEFVAWRVVLLGLIMPIIGTGFAIYANVCCPGDWVLQ